MKINQYFYKYFRTFENSSDKPLKTLLEIGKKVENFF